MTNTLTRKQGRERYIEKREVLKGLAKEVRQYLKTTGGTFGVRVQTNNVIWISGMYSFGVPVSQRQLAEKAFSHWLQKKVDGIPGLKLSDNMHKVISYKEDWE